MNYKNIFYQNTSDRLETFDTSDALDPVVGIFERKPTYSL